MVKAIMDNQLKEFKRRRNVVNGHHLVLVPCPLQGHMSPMLHLAKLLHSKGFFITIIVSSNEVNPPLSPSHYPEFLFQSININEDGTNNISYNSFGGDVMLYLLVLNNKCGTPLRDCLTKLQSNVSFFGPVSCVVYDAVMYFSAAIADELEIPRIVLRTSSASTFLALSLLRQNATLNTKEHDQPELPLADFPLIRAKDMPVFDTSDQEAVEEVLARIDHGTKTASAVIWNSLQCLEKFMFNKVEEKIVAPLYPICPRLHYINGNFGPNNSFESLLYTEDHSCMSWLDSQKPNAVVYVSTGSIVRISKSELAEMAWGLANSDQPFLWVVRPGLVNGSNGLELLPKGFLEITWKTGKVVQWAPQQRVLGHRSVGGFWTHNGWNSTIESVNEGVPMICWPRIGDQRVNARIVTSVWKVGIELEEKNLKRWKVERAIRKLMVDEEGKEIRKRAEELKEKVRVSLGQRGSSSEFLSKLVDFIKLLW
ncbi:UDP-glucuronosyl/UDP-glucosyltransferase [Trema orientale]|uniref:UDP-glucuronosyl/UDP-glucosyltransferase n=1 Tax=Trema orientale TaxID=63057 RepID=A0A2P5BIN9_TREOI|nr:UDP-glucuronosyl/UDP-glucosyltransferase [Trema orientale]